MGIFCLELGKKHTFWHWAQNWVRKSPDHAELNGFFLSISVTRHSPHHVYHPENTGTLATAVFPMLMDFFFISVTRHSHRHGYHQENTGTLATAVCPMVGRRVLTEITSPTSLSKCSFLLCTSICLSVHLPVRPQSKLSWNFMKLLL